MKPFYQIVKFFAIFIGLVQGQDSPKVCNDQGTCFKGSVIEPGLATFQGIRYAQAPIGDLRFKPPIPINQDNLGTIDASETSTVKCPQHADIGNGDLSMIGQEDCLLLNVYVPETAFDNPDDKLPVMFWIHGGALTAGSNNYEEYGPKHLVEKNLITVHVNYRLGPLGFLSMGTEDVPGNAGLRDQSLALAWVHENIAYFGGNPDLVTIFGESAGALSVALHITAPQSQNNFQRAVMHSDTAVGSAWGPITPEHALKYYGLLKKAVGCEDKEDALSCMQAQSIEYIFENEDVMQGGIVWNAVPDYMFTTDPFIPGEIEELLDEGQFNHDIEVIAGSNKDEGILYFIAQLLDPTQWEYSRTTFNTTGTGLLFNIADESEITDKDIENAHKLLNYYVGSVDDINEEHKEGMFKMFTDASFLFGIHNGIRYLLKHGVTVYQYLLTYQGEYSYLNGFGIPTSGVCHADDLFYIFGPVFGYDLPLKDEDEFVRHLMTTAWANFAKYGDPTPPDMWHGYEWTPRPAGDVPHYFNISGQDSAMATSAEIQERMALWDQVLEKN